MAAVTPDNLVDRITVKACKPCQRVGPEVFIPCIELDHLFQNVSDGLVRDDHLPVVVCDDEVPVADRYTADVDGLPYGKCLHPTGRVRGCRACPEDGKLPPVKKGRANFKNAFITGETSERFSQGTKGSSVEGLIPKIAIDLVRVTDRAIDNGTHGPIRE